VRDKIAYFISDAHLGARIPGGEGREEALISFLRETVSGAEYLFILGDLFDFWIEYRTAIRPDYFRVLHALRSLIENGTTVHYCMGNHDFALGPFMSSNLGLHLHPGEFGIRLQGRRLRLLHGEGIRKEDIANRILRRLLRNHLTQNIYKTLHPALGVSLGSKISGWSRRCNRVDRREKVLEKYRRIAREYLERGDDIVVFGHTHVAELEHFASGIYCNTGSWIRSYPFARLQDGELTLWLYREGEPPLPFTGGDKNGINS